LAFDFDSIIKEYGLCHGLFFRRKVFAFLQGSKNLFKFQNSNLETFGRDVKLPQLSQDSISPKAQETSVGRDVDFLEASQDLALQKGLQELSEVKNHQD